MNTAVMHLRARASAAADSAALRQLATGWLSQLQPHDHGLPRDAIVLVRQLRAQADAGPGPRGPAWRAAADQAWAHTLTEAARLVPGQAVPAAATAVWFADPVELLVNLLHDLAQGTLGQAWWWSLALRRGRVAGSLTDGAWQHLQRHARQLPLALWQLHPAQAAAARATGSRTQQQGLDEALLHHFGLHEAWFESRAAQGAAEADDSNATAAHWVALCRQMAIDPTPLRRAPGAQSVGGAHSPHAPVAGPAAAPHEPAGGERMRPSAHDTAWPATAASAAGPPGGAARRRVHEGPEAYGNAGQHIATEPETPGAGAALRPRLGAAGQVTGSVDRPAALPESWHAPIPDAPSRPERSRALRRASLVSAPDQAPQPSAAPWCQPSSTRILHSRCAGLLLLMNAALAMGLYGDFSQPRLPGLPIHPWHWLWLAARQLHGPAIKDDPLACWLRGAGRVQTGAAPPFAAWRPDVQTLEPWSHDTRSWIVLHQPQRPAVVLLHPAGFTVARLASADELPALWTRLDLPPPPVRWRQRLRGQPLHDPNDALHDLWPCLWARLALALHGSAAPVRSAKALAVRASTQAGRVEMSATRVRAVFSLAQWPLALRLAGLDRNPGWIPAAGCELVFDFE